MKYNATAYWVLLMVATAATATDMYRWKDHNGVTHYSESPPLSKTQEFRSFVIQNPKTPSQSNIADKPVNQSPACLNARHNLQLLSTNSKVMIDIDGDGKSETPLNADQVAQQKALAEEAVKASCIPESAHSRRFEPL